MLVVWVRPPSGVPRLSVFFWQSGKTLDRWDSPPTKRYSQVVRHMTLTHASLVRSQLPLPYWGVVKWYDACFGSKRPRVQFPPLQPKLHMRAGDMVRVADAAKLLGMNTQTLRLALQQGRCPFGYAVRTSEKRFTYYINETRLSKYLKGEL